MKKGYTIFAIYLLLIPGILCADDEAALSWSAVICAEGQDLGGVDTYVIEIGVGTNDKTLEAPPPPPEYSVRMEVINPNGPALSKYIQQQDTGIHNWVISVDPRGNIMPPGSRTATLSWDPLEFGEGSLELRQGSGGAGRIVVDDMKTTTSYDINGADMIYFTVVYTQ